MDSRYGLVLGKRVGDSFHCFDGGVLQADMNAARNVKARLDDPDIDRWTPYQKVKSLLLSRTNGQRLGLLNPESSCTGCQYQRTANYLMRNFAQVFRDSR